jgi:ATP-dependent RNA helicase DeaD
LQVARELAWLYRGAGARVITTVGGMDVRREQRLLHQGAEIVVGTPGRVCDHLDRGVLKLDGLKALVLDEAHEMLEMGFRDELEKILEAAPDERRTLMFSATFPNEVESLARKYTRDAERIQATSLDVAHEDIDYIVHLVSPGEREHAVVNVLRFHDAPSALVFCATRETTAHLHASLVERGFSAVALSGELSQAERNRALAAMREHRARVLVATDVAARGLDLPAVALVVHADLPHDAAVLQHRSGRTGRAGRKGTAVVLVPFPKKRSAQRLLDGIEVRVEKVPTAEQIRALDDQRLLQDVGEEIAQLDDEEQNVAGELLKKHSAEEIAKVLAKMFRKTRPAPEDLRETGEWKQERREKREYVEDGVWFRVNVGREQRADPKWLLPMLCRRGKITKRDLGKMEIRRRETRFAIAKAKAKSFAEATRRPDKKDPNIVIEPI